MKHRICILIFTLFVSSFSFVPAEAADMYQLSGPIILKNIETSSDDPYIIENFEINNPEGACIHLENVDHVIIRNNYLHGCGVGDGQEEGANSGAVGVFDSKGQVEIYNNRLHDNSYGILIDDSSEARVEIHDNEVRSSGRNCGIGVAASLSSQIKNNFVQYSGSEERQVNGIFVGNTRTIGIKDNIVISSSSSGIAINNSIFEKGVTQNIVVTGNDLSQNAEQGLFVTSAFGGEMSNNRISKNRPEENSEGSGSGIVLEKVQGFELSYNSLSYNNKYGIVIKNSSNNLIKNNNIHHNGEGAIAWLVEGSSNNKISNNQIHDNRVAAFVVKTNNPGRVEVENNSFEANGGGVINYKDYDDYDTSLHLEDWVYDKKSVLLGLQKEDAVNSFNFSGNTIDGLQQGDLNPEDHYVFIEEKSSDDSESFDWQRVLGASFLLVGGLVLLIFYFIRACRNRKKRGDFDADFVSIFDR